MRLKTPDVYLRTSVLRMLNEESRASYNIMQKKKHLYHSAVIQSRAAEHHLGVSMIQPFFKVYCKVKIPDL